VDEVKLKVVYLAQSSSQSEGYEDGNLGSLSYQEVRILFQNWLLYK
jgi:hypothetical protein